jgi:hypothetical protein
MPILVGRQAGVVFGTRKHPDEVPGSRDIHQLTGTGMPLAVTRRVLVQIQQIPSASTFENNLTTPARYQPCVLLPKAGIPYTVWFEDALAYYGVPTDVFSLYVLDQHRPSSGTGLRSEWLDRRIRTTRDLDPFSLVAP